MKVKIEVDVPDGWRAVAYRLARPGDWYLGVSGVVQSTITTNAPWLILEKVEPKRESRWFPVTTRLCDSNGYEDISEAIYYCPRHRIERRDYENGKLVAVTLEPEGEEA